MIRTVRVKRHWRQGSPVKGYVRRHNYIASLKGGPEFKREVEKNRDLFEGPLPVNIRQEGYVAEEFLGAAYYPSLFRGKSLTGINVDVSTSVPDWKSIIVHEGYHVRERQKGRRESLEEERANLEAIKRVPSEAKYKDPTGSLMVYPAGIFRKPSPFARREMAAAAKRETAALQRLLAREKTPIKSPTVIDLERLHTRKRKR